VQHVGLQPAARGKLQSTAVSGSDPMMQQSSQQLSILDLQHVAKQPGSGCSVAAIWTLA
jgi:hypothetical protein